MAPGVALEVVQEVVLEAIQTVVDAVNLAETDQDRLHAEGMELRATPGAEATQEAGAAPAEGVARVAEADPAVEADLVVEAAPVAEGDVFPVMCIFY